ncbi:hypothetical protein ABVK25_011329 [Lepraria finkii]|uniref:Rhodopsin domain-containing protein n=1 Tax=Lepraria finkii TaxID=1340010 RepID=A0ABR4AT16_9LECA
MFTKVSICLLLLRIAPSKKVIRPVQGLIVVLVVSNVILSMFWILQCTPPDAAWNATSQETVICFTQGQIQRIIIFQTIISLLSDIVLSASPILVIRAARTTLRQKLLLSCLIGLGLMTATCCLVRTVLSWQTDQADQTWTGVDNVMWRSAEVVLGTIAACLPTLPPLWSLLHDKIDGIRKHRTGRREEKWLFGRLRRGPRNMERAMNSISQKKLPMPPNARIMRNEQSGYYGHRDSESEMQGAGYGSEARYSQLAGSETGYRQVVDEHLELARRVMDFQPVLQRERPRLQIMQMGLGEGIGDGNRGTVRGRSRSDWSQEVWDGISRLDVEPLRVAFQDV